MQDFCRHTSKWNLVSAPTHFLLFSLWRIVSPDGFWQCCSLPYLSHFLLSLKFPPLHAVFSSIRFHLVDSAFLQCIQITLNSKSSRALSLRSSSPCALLFMKAGPKELYMQMLRASCIPPRLGLCASTARLGSVCCPCRLLREMDVPDSEIPTLSLRCLPWDEMTFKAVGTHGPLAGVVIQAHIISVQLKVDVIPIIWGFQSTNDDGTMVGFWLGCPN